MEFNIKIVPRDTEISSSSASITGATAAIALPPQIAVPADIKFDVLSFTLRSLPRKNPTASVPKIVAIVNRIPCFPALTTSVKFIPKPNKTTEICNKILVAFFVCCGKGFPNVKAAINPKTKAIGGETQVVRQTKIRSQKIIFCQNISQKVKSEKRKVKSYWCNFSLFVFHFSLTLLSLDSPRLPVLWLFRPHRLSNSFLSVSNLHRVHRQAECPSGCCDAGCLRR